MAEVSFHPSANSRKRASASRELENQRLAKIVCIVSNVIINEHAPKSIKELIGFRNNKYNLRGSDILIQLSRLLKIVLEHWICQVYCDNNFLSAFHTIQIILISIHFFIVIFCFTYDD